MKAKESPKVKNVSLASKIRKMENQANYRSKEVEVLAAILNPDGSYIKFDKDNPDHQGKKTDIIKNGAFQRAKQRGRKRTENKKEVSLHLRTRRTVAYKSEEETSHTSKGANELPAAVATAEIPPNQTPGYERRHIMGAISLAALSVVENDPVQVTTSFAPARLFPGALSHGFFGSSSRPENLVEEIPANNPAKSSRNT